MVQEQRPCLDQPIDAAGHEIVTAAYRVRMEAEARSMIGRMDEARPFAMHQVLGGLSQADLATVITIFLPRMDSVSAVAVIRNAAPQPMIDPIADRYSDHLPGEGAA